MWSFPSIQWHIRRLLCRVVSFTGSIIFDRFYYFFFSKKSPLLSLVALFLTSKLREATQNGWGLGPAGIVHFQQPPLSFSLCLSPPFLQAGSERRNSFHVREKTEKRRERRGKGSSLAVEKFLFSLIKACLYSFQRPALSQILSDCSVLLFLLWVVLPCIRIFPDPKTRFFFFKACSLVRI